MNFLLLRHKQIIVEFNFLCRFLPKLISCSTFFDFCETFITQFIKDNVFLQKLWKKKFHTMLINNQFFSTAMGKRSNKPFLYYVYQMNFSLFRPKQIILEFNFLCRFLPKLIPRPNFFDFCETFNPIYKRQFVLTE